MIQADIKERIPYFVLLVIFSVTFLFQLFYLPDKSRFFYGYSKSPYWFIGSYVISLFLCFGMSFLPSWAFLTLPFAYVCIATSTPLLGFCGYLQIMFFYAILSGCDFCQLFAYLGIGFITTALFSERKEDEKAISKLLFSFVFLFAVLLATKIIIIQGLNLTGFVEVILQTVCNFFVFLILSHFFVGKVILRKKEQYQELNDPENELLVELKSKNVYSYYHAVHTAYFCEKLALQIGADARVCKAAGYYHKIGTMRGQGNLKNTLMIAKEYHFPDELTQILTEYGSKNTVLKSKEAALVLISDAMVSTVTYLFEQNKDAKLDYEQITELVLQRHMSSHIFDHASLTLNDLYLIKKYFVEDTVYYDFLR